MKFACEEEAAECEGVDVDGPETERIEDLLGERFPVPGPVVGGRDRMGVEGLAAMNGFFDLPLIEGAADRRGLAGAGEGDGSLLRPLRADLIGRLGISEWVEVEEFGRLGILVGFTEVEACLFLAAERADRTVNLAVSRISSQVWCSLVFSACARGSLLTPTKAVASDTISLSQKDMRSSSCSTCDFLELGLCEDETSEGWSGKVSVCSRRSLMALSHRSAT